MLWNVNLNCNVDNIAVSVDTQVDFHGNFCMELRIPIFVCCKVYACITRKFKVTKQITNSVSMSVFILSVFILNTHSFIVSPQKFNIN